MKWLGTRRFSAVSAAAIRSVANRSRPGNTLPKSARSSRFGFTRWRPRIAGTFVTITATTVPDIVIGSRLFTTSPSARGPPYSSPCAAACTHTTGPGFAPETMAMGRETGEPSAASATFSEPRTVCPARPFAVPIETGVSAEERVRSRARLRPGKNPPRKLGGSYLARLLRDDDLALHLPVPHAAELGALELVGAGLL